MEKQLNNSSEVFKSEEEKFLNWTEVQAAFQKTFGTEVHTSWLKNISLLNINLLT